MGPSDVEVEIGVRLTRGAAGHGVHRTMDDVVEVREDGVAVAVSASDGGHRGLERVGNRESIFTTVVFEIVPHGCVSAGV